jgi:hypothetical protein
MFIGRVQGELEELGQAFIMGGEDDRGPHGAGRFDGEDGGVGDRTLEEEGRLFLIRGEQAEREVFDDDKALEGELVFRHENSIL